MRFYQKTLLIGALCGFICIFGYPIDFKIVPIVDVIHMFGMNYITFAIGDLEKIIIWFVPLLIFQIIYGTYIYRRFATASVYFFSRTNERIKWILTEEVKLYLYGVVYLILMIAGGLIAKCIAGNMVLGADLIREAAIFFAVFSLYLFVYTLMINVLSIIFNSNVGFVISEAINIFFMTAYCMSFDYVMTPNGEINPDKMWILEINPFYQLKFDELKSSGDYITSIAVYFIAALALVIASCVVIEKHNFINGDNEK